MRNVIEIGPCLQGAPGGPIESGSNWGAAAEAPEQCREGPLLRVTHQGGLPGAGGAAAEVGVEYGLEREWPEAVGSI